MNRSVSLTITVEDYVTANRLHSLKSSRTTLVGWILAYVVWMAIALDDWRAINVIVLNACFAAVTLCMLAYYFLWIPNATGRTYRKHRELQRPHVYSWSESGLTVQSDRGEWRLAWSDCLKWTENAQVMIFYQAPRLFIMLPKRALTPEQIADVRQCASRIGEE